MQITCMLSLTVSIMHKKKSVYAKISGHSRPTAQLFERFPPDIDRHKFILRSNKIKSSLKFSASIFELNFSQNFCYTNTDRLFTKIVNLLSARTKMFKSNYNWKFKILTKFNLSSNYIEENKNISCRIRSAS